MERQGRLRPEDLYNLKVAEECRISPDGGYIIYTVSRLDRTSGRRQVHLLLCDVKSGKSMRLSIGKNITRSPRWTPDGSSIFFISGSPGNSKTEIRQIFLADKKQELIHTLDGDIVEMEISPDGKNILLQFKKNTDHDERPFHHITTLFYKRDGQGYILKNKWNLCILNIPTKRLHHLTDRHIIDEAGPRWSPDGRYVAYLSNRSDDPDRYPDAIDICIMPADGGRPRIINTPAGPKTSLSFSPDGRYIAYTGHEGLNSNWKNSSVWIIDLGRNGGARNITSRYDIDAVHKTINDISTPKSVPPIWSSDGKKLFFQATVHGDTVLFSSDISGSNLSPVLEGPGVIQYFDMDRGKSILSYIKADIASPGDLWILDISSGKSERLSNLNGKLLGITDLGETEMSWLRGKRSRRLQGWLIKPPGFDSSRKYPAILSVHGGPRFQYGNAFMFEFYLLASFGYIVYFCNPAGSRGYGENHARALSDSWGEADYRDLIRWDNAVSRRVYIDKTRKGIMGHSYGGYLTNWIISHTRRFGAAAVSGGISNLISLWGTGDYNWWIQEDFGDRSPIDDFRRYWDRSPLKHARKVRTPTLVIQNGRDMRCPVEQGEQWYVALKKAGVMTEMVVFPKESHITRNADRILQRMDLIRKWFDRFLLGQGIDRH